MSWETDTLSNNAKVISGFAFKSDSFRTDKGVPIIKIKNIQREYVEIDGEYFVEDSFLSLDPKYHCVKSDILISLTGSHITLPNSVVGRVAKYHYDFTSLLNQRGGKIVVTNPKKLWNDYLYYFLCQNEIRIKLAQFGRGGANQCNISPSNVESITIILPPLQTQKRIASILSAYDDLIENNLKRIKLLEETAQNIYKEWFVNFRFPNYENTPFNQETGLPEGWEVKRIGSIVEFKGGFPFKSSEYSENGKYRIVTIKNVGDRFFDGNNTSGIENIPDKMKEFCKLQEGNILMSLTGNIGRTCLVYGDNFLLNQRVVIIAPNNSENIAFCYFLFNTDSIKGLMNNLASGVAQQNLSPVKLEEQSIPLPPLSLMLQFSSITNEVVNQIISLNKQNQTLIEARDILLPRLMNRTIEV
ncbi:MAG: restriction endonuclease subunit S [Crocinitomicaceae bacterium]|nr:restriction endonuclease subunit S [Crocinitomicaceae bacterium]